MAQDESSAVRDFYLGSEFIVDRTQNLVGMELRFRSAKDASSFAVSDPSARTAALREVFSDLDLGGVLGRYRGFVQVTPDLLTSDVVSMILKEKVALCLYGMQSITPETIAHCTQLKKSGYAIAADEIALTESPQAAALRSVLDMVKVDVSVMKSADLQSAVPKFKRYTVPLLADGIERREQAEQCLALGFDFMEGHYFAKPLTVQGKRLNQSEIALLDLLGMLLSDADVEKVVGTLKHHPDLSVSLIKVVNSAAAGAKTHITSLSQAIVVLGRAALKRWVQVLLFTVGGTPGVEFPSPLLVLAASRGRLMELIARKIRNHDKQFQEKAYLVGMLSLLNAHFGVELAELIQSLPLGDDVADALLKQSGQLGSWLTLTELLDMPGFTDAQFSLPDMGDLEARDLLALQLEAASWAISFGSSN